MLTSVGRSMMREVVVLIVLVLTLSSCEWVKDIAGQKKIPLPGERIPVMLNEGGLQADPRVSDLRVLLPAPQKI